MARRLHKKLLWEKRQIKRAEHNIRSLSELLYATEKICGKQFVEDHVYTWQSGVSIWDTTKEQYHTLKAIIPWRTNEMQKESGKNGLVLTGRGYPSDDNDVSLLIEFKWGLPKSCQLSYVKNIVEVEDDDYYTDEGRILKVERKTVVDCGDKPLLETVFAEQ